MNEAEIRRTNRQITGLSTLLQLEKEIRHVENLQEFGFVVTNEVYRLFPYRQAVFWQTYPSGDVRVHSVSSSPEIDRNAPFIQWIEKVIKNHQLQENAHESHLITIEDIPENFHEGWKEWMAPYILWSPMVSPEGELLGGIWFARDKNWDKSEIGLCDWLRDSFSYTMDTLIKQKKIKFTLPQSKTRKKVIWASLAIIFLIMLIPVEQSALAPAEVKAKDAETITSPIKGVVEEIVVKPNQLVKAGDKLIKFDETSIRNQFEVAKKSLDVARARFKKATQKGFLDAESRAQASILKAQMILKEVELAYAGELLNRIDIRANKQAIVVYDDPSEWVGRPVLIGEKIMSLANPENIELQLWLPVADAINLEKGAKIRVFFNVDPLNPYTAELIYGSYEAELTPEGVLAYRVRARFMEDTKDVRIGLKGTGKIYGEKVTLAYFLFRRPLAAARRILGI